MKFIKDQPVHLEEDKHYEFKEIKGKNAVDTIKSTVDEYAVAYLNSEGGRVLWGIRDSDAVVAGVVLNAQEKDELRRKICGKLLEIQPKIDTTACLVELHPVYNLKSEIISDLFVVEVAVPSSNSTTLYFTGGNEAFVKINGAKNKLKGTQIQDWIVRRYLYGNWSKAKDLAEVALLFDKLLPILYGMYQPVPSSDRDYIYNKFQEFFRDLGNYSNELTQIKNPHFLAGTEVLLRVATNFWRNGEPEESTYLNSKIWIAHEYFIDYFDERGFSDYAWDKERINRNILDFRDHMIALSGDFTTFTKKSQNSSKLENSIIKFLMLIMDHLWAEWKARKRLDIPEGVMLQFQELADPLCKTYFGVNLPNREQKGILHDLKLSCHYYQIKS